MIHQFTISTGESSVILPLFIAHSTTGAGLTGLTFESAGLFYGYHRPGGSSSSGQNLEDASLGTYTSGGFKEIDSAGLPGAYEFGLPSGVAGSVGRWVVLLYGATNMAPCRIVVESNAGTIGDIRKIVQAQR
jgi:hypothetical protein